jgi:hypothetical protein
MSATITYKELFEVKILHYYFLNRGETLYNMMSDEEQAKVMLYYDVGEFFDIVPTKECKRLLDSYQCIFKQTSQGMIVGMRTESDGQDPPHYTPFVSLKDDLEFTFRMEIKDHDFMNHAVLPFIGNTGTGYIFENLTASAPKQFPSLNAVAPLFESGAEYLPGDMLSNNLSNPTELYIAQLKTSSNTSTTPDWLTEKKSDGLSMHYTNINDRHLLVNGILNYKVSVADVEPTATVKKRSGTVVKPKVEILQGDFRILQVDLRDFPEGFYTMDVESVSPPYSDTISFYLVRQNISPFGTIRIKVKSDDDSYNLIDSQGFMTSPSFEVSFRNRATHWRYIGQQFNENSVTDEPLPLTHVGIIENVTVLDKDGLAVSDLPNPSVKIIKTEALTNTTEKKYYSEIHINKS